MQKQNIGITITITTVLGILLTWPVTFAQGIYQYNESSMDFLKSDQGTACGGQPQPPAQCGDGYNLMCITNDNPHWGCGKLVNGKIIEAGAVTQASSNAFIKFDGVEGETAKSSTDDSGTLKVKVNTAASLRATTTTKGQPKYDDDREEKKGNVEYEWKVEEGGDDNLVSISAVEVRGWDDDRKKEFLATVRTHAEVRSGQELENFARGVMLENQAMEEIAFNYEKIKLKYESEGKLFGFIPISFKKDVLVDLAEEDTAARVKVKFPWYRFMMSVDVSADDLEGAISEGMSDVLAGATTTAQLSLEARVTIVAKMMSTVSNILKTKHDTVKNSISNVR